MAKAPHPPPSHRRLAAIVFTDMVGYTALMQRDERMALGAIERHRKAVEKYTRQYSGEVVHYYGDGSLSLFHSAIDATECALAIQKDLTQAPAVPLKVGIHLGDVVLKDKAAFGDGVNVASRIQALGGAGSILITDTICNLVKNQEGIRPVRMGKFRLKNVDDPVAVYALNADFLTLPSKERVQHNAGAHPGRRKWAIAALIATITVLAGFAAGRLMLREKALPEVADKSIAVLPLQYLGADKSRQYLADGVLDAITSHLAGIPELRVIARSSVEKYRQSTADARDIGKDLRVSYLLEGSFQLEGDRVRLTAQLVHSKDGSHLWSRTYDREWRDIFSVQSEVAMAIAEAIKITVSPEAKASMQARSTPDLTAYEYYLKARHYFIYDYQEDNHTYAIQMYEKALERDPGFAPAWLGLVEAYRSQYWLFMDRSDELVARIKTCLAKAKALEPDSKEYRWHEALYLHSIEREYPTGDPALEKMLADYPNDDLLLSFMGFAYGTMGIYDKCAEYLEAAIALNPADWDYWNTISIFYEAMRKYDEAMRCNRWLIDNYPSFIGAYERIVGLYLSAGLHAEAEAFIEQHQNNFGGPVGLSRQQRPGWRFIKETSKRRSASRKPCPISKIPGVGPILPGLPISRCSINSPAWTAPQPFISNSRGISSARRSKIQNATTGCTPHWASPVPGWVSPKKPWRPAAGPSNWKISRSTAGGVSGPNTTWSKS
jgi:adenylate cyclase